MRIFLAIAMAASLAVAAGCSCATGECGAPVDDCAPCGVAPVAYETAPVVYEPARIVAVAPAPMAIAPAAPVINCDPCRGL